MQLQKKKPIFLYKMGDGKIFRCRNWSDDLTSVRLLMSAFGFSMAIGNSEREVRINGAHTHTLSRGEVAVTILDVITLSRA